MKSNMSKGTIMPVAIGIGLVLFVLVIVFFSKLYYVSPGNVGIMVYKSGQNEKGVSETPLNPGWGFRKLFTEEVVEYPTFLQTAVWTKLDTEGSENDDSITANTKEGLPVNIDISMSYTLESAKIPDLYTKYRSDISNIQATFLRQSVRQAIQDVFGGYTVEDVYGAKKQEIVAKIQGLLVERLTQDGFNFQQFTINEIRLPEQVVASINQKIKAGQEVLTAQQELAKVKIEAEKRIAQATAEAEAIAIQAKAVTQQGGQAYVDLQWINKWNGALPTTQMGGAVTPLVSINK